MNKDIALLGSLAASMLAIPLAVLAAAGLSPTVGNRSAAQTVYPVSLSAAQSADAGSGAAAEAPASAADITSFRVLDSATGEVAELPALEYIRGVLAGELPTSYHIEAMKAQAVAAYTVSVYEAKRQRAAPEPELLGADFASDAESHQRYISEETARELYGSSFDYIWAKLTDAAEVGVSHLLLYESEPILAAYHAISAGHTESSGNVWEGELPYLAGVSSDWDMLAPGFRSSVSFTREELSALLAEHGVAAEGELSGWIEVLERSEAGYVTAVRAGDTVMSGGALRALLGLRSSCFEVVCNAQTLTFEVKGYGHGAGLSQNGSDYMARQGSDYREILEHYYPGAQLLP